jgi:hypothetical protein
MDSSTTFQVSSKLDAMVCTFEITTLDGKFRKKVDALLDSGCTGLDLVLPIYDVIRFRLSEIRSVSEMSFFSFSYKRNCLRFGFFFFNN